MMAAAECVICLEAIRPDGAVWQCPYCYLELDLPCIQGFVRASLAPQSKLLAQIALNVPLEWHCPHCRHTFRDRDYPTSYRCYCGATVDPPFDPWLPPHSCGGPCGKQRDSCSHPCKANCHSGPCPPCSLSVEVSCWCGRETYTTRCGVARSSCGHECEKKGQARHGGTRPSCFHACPTICHEGPCPSCEVQLPMPCRCRSAVKMVACKDSVWGCTKPCGKQLDCGRHLCTLVCHAGACPPCPNAGLRTCPCGKAMYAMLQCDETPPVCGDTCGRPLACGSHTCEQRCHPGTCGPCTAVIDTPCRCGRTSKRRLCSDGPLLCNIRCEVQRSCGRHACKRRCCQGLGPEPEPAGPLGQPVGGASSATAGSSSGAGGAGAATGSGEGEGKWCPPCREACGRRLNCRKHTCPAYCHAGPCSSCPLTVVLSCPCGGTQRAVPCGQEAAVPPPACVLPCTRPSQCLHPLQAPHPCHAGPCPPCTLACGQALPRCDHECAAQCHAVSVVSAVERDDDGRTDSKMVVLTLCPPCPVPVARSCVGGHVVRSSLPCSSPALFRCTLSCGRLLAPCSRHQCQKPCHAVDPEHASDSCGTCLLPCELPRPAGCEHGCGGSGCHAGPCPPCAQAVVRRCLCERATLTLPCLEVQRASAAASPSAAMDALLHCHQKCRLHLPSCGHLCAAGCHTRAVACGAVAPCSKTVTVRCRCGGLKEDWDCARATAARLELGVAFSALDPARALVLLPCGQGACAVAAAVAEGVAEGVAAGAAATATEAQSSEPPAALGGDSNGTSSTAAPRRRRQQKQEDLEKRARVAAVVAGGTKGPRGTLASHRFLLAYAAVGLVLAMLAVLAYLAFGPSVAGFIKRLRGLLR